jgi:hypothetical protein
VSDPTTPTSLVPAVVGLISAILLGRVLLSLLPSGTPGHHSARGLAVTLSTSYLLGSIAIAAEERLLAAMGAPAHLSIIAAPWLAVAIARWITLPGAMVPRLEAGDASSRAPRSVALIASGLAVLAVAMIAWSHRVPLFSRTSSRSGAAAQADVDVLAGVLSIADVLSLLAIFAYGVERARMPAVQRALLTLALAFAVALPAFAEGGRPATSLALSFGAGTAFAVSWLRRADRRALMLSLLAFAGTGIESGLGSVLGFLGIAVLFASSARPSRRTVGVTGVIAFALATLLHVAGGDAETPVPNENGSSVRLAVRASVFLALAGSFAALWMVAAWNQWRARRVYSASASGGLEIEAESGFLALDAVFVSEIGAATLIALPVFGQITGEFASVESISLLAPILLFSVGIVFARDETSDLGA